MSDRLSSLNTATYFHDVAAIGGRFYTDGREAKLEPGNIMVWSVNIITLGEGLESITEGVSDV